MGSAVTRRHSNRTRRAPAMGSRNCASSQWRTSGDKARARCRQPGKLRRGRRRCAPRFMMPAFLVFFLSSRISCSSPPLVTLCSSSLPDHEDARTLLPAALASVPFGFVLARVRVPTGLAAEDGGSGRFDLRVREPPAVAANRHCALLAFLFRLLCHRAVQVRPRVRRRCFAGD